MISYGTDVNVLFTRCSFGFIGYSNREEMYQSMTKPFINDFLRQLNIRFPQSSLAFCKSANMLFCSTKYASIQNESELIQQLADSHSLLTDKKSNLEREYKCFRNYLSSQTHPSETAPTATDIMKKLAQPESILSESFPILSSAAMLLLLCPIGTASVERSFSAMHRISTKLRNRLTSGNIAHLMRISIEAPETLTTATAEEIVRLWHASEPTRRIGIL